MAKDPEELAAIAVDCGLRVHRPAAADWDAFFDQPGIDIAVPEEIGPNIIRQG